MYTVATVECPKCKRPHTTSFKDGERVKDVTCADCIRARIDEEQAKDRS